jgi:hypothetical protein
LRHHTAGHGPGRFLLATLLLLTTSNATGQWIGLQYRTTLGDPQPSGRLALYVERGRLPGGIGSPKPDPAVPRHSTSDNLVGLPVFHHGPYVPGLVYQAVTAQSETRRDNLSKLCLSRPLSCTVSGVMMAGSPFLDLGLYGNRQDAGTTLGPVHLAP